MLKLASKSARQQPVLNRHSVKLQHRDAYAPRKKGRRQAQAQKTRQTARRCTSRGCLESETTAEGTRPPSARARAVSSAAPAGGRPPALCSWLCKVVQSAAGQGGQIWLFPGPGTRQLAITKGIDVQESVLVWNGWCLGGELDNAIASARQHLQLVRAAGRFCVLTLEQGVRAARGCVGCERTTRRLGDFPGLGSNFHQVSPLHQDN